MPSIQVNVKESKKHVEINLSETKGYEKHVIVELINERKHKASIRSAPCHHDDCKGITSFCNLYYPKADKECHRNDLSLTSFVMYTAIILGEADKLSTDVLLYTKWMLERYTGCYKVFFCCSDITKLQPIKSICKVVHLQKPSDDEVRMHGTNTYWI